MLLSLLHRFTAGIKINEHLRYISHELWVLVLSGLIEFEPTRGATRWQQAPAKPTQLVGINNGARDRRKEGGRCINIESDKQETGVSVGPHEFHLQSKYEERLEYN